MLCKITDLFHHFLQWLNLVPFCSILFYAPACFPHLEMQLTVAKDFSSVYFTPCQRNLSEKLEDYASYLLIGEEETFDSNWIVEDNERGFHISLHYKGDRLNKHSPKVLVGLISVQQNCLVLNIRRTSSFLLLILCLFNLSN